MSQTLIFTGVSCFSIVISAYALLRIKRLHELRKIFFSGPSGKDMEQLLRDVIAGIKKQQNDHEALQQTVTMLQKESLAAIQKIGVVRFNPFDDGGGNFSFSVALLNAEKTGVVITSIHGRQQNRIYAKQILNGQSISPLTEEERQAIAEAGKSSENSI